VVMINSLAEGAGYSKENLTVVTREGQVMTDQQFVQMGSVGKNAGIRVGLKDKIKKIDDNLSEVNRNISNKQEELDHAKESFQQIGLNQLQKKLDECRQRIRKKENALNAGRSKIQVYESNIEELANRKKSLRANEKKAEEN